MKDLIKDIQKNQTKFDVKLDESKNKIDILESLTVSNLNRIEENTTEKLKKIDTILDKSKNKIEENVEKLKKIDHIVTDGPSMSEINIIINRIIRKERFLNILLLFTSIIFGVVTFVGGFIWMQFSKLNNDINKTFITSKIIAETHQKINLIENRIDEKMFYEAESYSEFLIKDLQREKKSGNSYLVKDDRYNEVIEQLLLSAHGINGFVNYRIKDDVSNIHAVIENAEEMLKIDITNARAHRLLALGKWRLTLYGINIDKSEIKKSLYSSIDYNDSEYSVDKLNLMEFLFTSLYFTEAFHYGKNIEPKIRKIYPSKSAEYAFYIFYYLSGYISTPDTNSSYLQLLNEKIEEVEKLDSKNLEWGCDFLNYFYENELCTNEKISEQKKDVLKLFIERYFDTINFDYNPNKVKF